MAGPETYLPGFIAGSVRGYLVYVRENAAGVLFHDAGNLIGTQTDSDLHCTIHGNIVLLGYFRKRFILGW